MVSVEFATTPELAREETKELVKGDVIEGGKPDSSLEGESAIASFIGTDDNSLPTPR